MLQLTDDHMYCGLSNDYKPTGATVADRCHYLNTDTGEIYEYHAEDEQWHLMGDLEKPKTVGDILDEMRRSQEEIMKNLLESMRQPLSEKPVALICPNCGAPLRGNKCEYCDSEFIFEPKTVHFDKKSMKQQEALYKQAIKAFREYRADCDLMTANEMREAIGLPQINF